MGDGSMLYPTSTIAKLFNMTERNVRYLEEQGIIEKSDRGKYDLGSTVQRYVKYLQEKALGRQIEGSDYEKEKTLHEKAKREKTELLLAKMRNEVFSADYVESVMANILVTFRNRILSIPKKISPQLIAVKSITKISTILDNEIRSALEELSEYDPSIFTEELIEYEDEDDDETNEKNSEQDM